MVNKQIVFNNSRVDTFINEDINIANDVLQVQITDSTTDVNMDSHSPDSRQHTSGYPEVGVLDCQTSMQGNITECAQITHDYDITDYDKYNVAGCSDRAHRGLSLDNDDAGIPYNGASRFKIWVSSGCGNRLHAIQQQL
jgi:hypothetical protein